MPAQVQYVGKGANLYELGYELNNRPDWAGIPITGISHVLESIAA